MIENENPGYSGMEECTINYLHLCKVLKESAFILKEVSFSFSRLFKVNYLNIWPFREDG